MTNKPDTSGDEAFARELQAQFDAEANDAAIAEALQEEEYAVYTENDEEIARTLQEDEAEYAGIDYDFLVKQQEELDRYTPDSGYYTGATSAKTTRTTTPENDEQMAWKLQNEEARRAGLPPESIPSTLEEILSGYQKTKLPSFKKREDSRRSGPLLSDEQVKDVLINRLANVPDIAAYNYNLAPLNSDKIPEDNISKAIVVETGMTGTNVGDVVKEAYEHLTINLLHGVGGEPINPAEYSFVVPVNLGAPKKFDSHPDINAREFGNHWVLAVFKPDEQRLRDRTHETGKIPLQMTFIDSMHDSKSGQPSPAGKAILASAQRSGLDVGTDFNDLSCGQQNDGWSCGYWVAANAENAIKGKAPEHISTKELLAHAENVLGHNHSGNRSFY